MLTEWLQGAPMMAALVGTGLYLSVRCGFPQITRFRDMLSGVRRALGQKSPSRGGVTPLQAVCTALAASVGTGNVAGVAGAIALGGPGAVFWMWVSAFFGMCTKSCEIALSVRYRRKGRKGEWLGGPMYAMRDGLHAPALAGLYALCGASAAFGIGNLAQVHTITDTLRGAVASVVPLTATGQAAVTWGIGLVCAAAAGYVLLGGAKRLGEVAGTLVPVMAGIYLLSAAAVICVHIRDLPGVFAAILRGAFSPPSVTGGAAGIGIRQAVIHGVGRGVFSNEAGLGSAAIAHASAQTRDPAEQGLMGIFEVFADTVVICTVTALVILLGVPNVPYGRDMGAALTVRGFASVFGGAAAGIVAVTLSLFALSSVLAWGLYGRACARYLLGERAGKLYLAVFCLTCAVGGSLRLEAVWRLAELLNGVMALPNLIALLRFAPECAAIWKRGNGT